MSDAGEHPAAACSCEAAAQSMLPTVAMAKRPTKPEAHRKSSSRKSGGRRGVDLKRAELARDSARVFQEAHEFGALALRARDLKGFGEAIAVERGLIGEQRATLEEQGDAIKKQREVIRAIRHGAKLNAHKTRPLPAGKKASKKRTSQTEGMRDDALADDEHRQLLEEHDALEREHATLEGHPHDFEGHEAHRAKLRDHIRKLQAHIARIRGAKKED